MSAPKTYIIDVDGCLTEHMCAMDWGESMGVLPGARQFLARIEREGACIVLMTARKESNRSHLESELRRLGLYWDQLVMGVTHGPRVLINDAKPPVAPAESDVAVAVVVRRNVGLENVKI